MFYPLLCRLRLRRKSSAWPPASTPRYQRVRLVTRFLRIRSGCRWFSRTTKEWRGFTTALKNARASRPISLSLQRDLNGSAYKVHAKFTAFIRAPRFAPRIRKKHTILKTTDKLFEIPVKHIPDRAFITGNKYNRVPGCNRVNSTQIN